MRFYSYNNKKSLVNLSNSILKKFGVPTFHDSIKEIDDILLNHDKICVVLLDGFGKSVQDANFDKNSPLIKHRFMEISSTFPPTTVAATNGFLSGKYGNETHWLAWAIFDEDSGRSIEMFRGKDYETKEQLIDGAYYRNKYPYKNILELIKENNEDVYGNGLMHCGGKECTSIGSEILFNDADRELNKFSKGFLYVYDDEPDHTLHTYGTTAKESKEKMNYLLDKFYDLVEKHKDTLFILIADHSHINCDTIYLDEYPEVKNLVKGAFSLESRMPSFNVKEGKIDEFIKLTEKLWGKYFDIVKKGYFIENKCFGEGENYPNIEKNLGDVTLIAIGDKRMEFGLPEDDLTPIKSNHGGGTKEENIIAVSIFNN